MSETAFPLKWPDGRKRTDRWSRERAKFDVTFARARDNVIHEVQLLVGRYYEPHTVISTNIALRRDGFPLANQRAPEDVGVAVYFTYKKRQMSFACDRWEKIEHNMQAIAKTIEALRGIERWGTGDMLEAAFTGFTALPPPATTSTGPKHWRDVLGNTIRTRQEAQEIYRRLASAWHPDRNDGDGSKMAELNAARDQALRELQS